MEHDHQDPVQFLINAKLTLMADGFQLHDATCPVSNRENGAWVACSEGCPGDAKGNAIWLIDQALRRIFKEREAR